MSRIVKQNIVCPECGANSEIDMWESVNVTLDPAMYKKVRDGSLFKYRCPNCGFKSRLVYPTLYHDMEKKQMVYLCTTANFADDAKKRFDDMRSGKTAELVKETEEGGADCKSALDSDYTLRIVPTYDKLKEKLFILDAGLDDRVIELYKLTLWSMLSEQGNKLERTSYFYTAHGEDGAEKRRIQFFKKDGGSGSSEFDPEMYDRLAEIVRRAGYAEEYIIDEQWADDVMGHVFSASGN